MSANNEIRNGNPADCEIHGRSGAALGPTVNSSGWYGGAYGCPAAAVCFCTRYGDWDATPVAATPVAATPVAATAVEAPLAPVSAVPENPCYVCGRPCVNTGCYSTGANGSTCDKGCYDASWEMEPPPPPPVPFQPVAPLNVLPTGCNGCVYGVPRHYDGGLAASSAAPDGLFVDERDQVEHCPLHAAVYNERWGTAKRASCKLHSGGGLTYSTNSAGWCGGAYGGPAELFGCTCSY